MPVNKIVRHLERAVELLEALKVRVEVDGEEAEELLDLVASIDQVIQDVSRYE